MATKIQLRRDTSENWTSINPTLFSGEVGFETNTGKFKIGNGSTVWSSLDYFGGEVDLSEYLTISSASTTYQPLDNHLTSISELGSTNYGALRKDGNIWFLDTNNYAPIDSPTFTGISQMDTILYLGLNAQKGKLRLGNGNNGTAAEVGVDNANIAYLQSMLGDVKIIPATGYYVYISDDTGTNKVATQKWVEENPIGFKDKTSTSNTLNLNDNGKFVKVSNSSANTLEVPLNSTSAFPVGSQITVMQTNTGQTTLTAAAGVTLTSSSGLKFRAQYSSATLVKLATDQWVAIGDLTT
jgi:hypothetical protein